jgi:hypothetical protein
VPVHQLGLDRRHSPGRRRQRVHAGRCAMPRTSCCRLTGVARHELGQVEVSCGSGRTVRSTTRSGTTSKRSARAPARSRLPRAQTRTPSAARPRSRGWPASHALDAHGREAGGVEQRFALAGAASGRRGGRPGVDLAVSDRFR